MTTQTEVTQRTFVVPGRPKSKDRPRIWKNKAYTPQATKDYEAKVKQSYLDVNGDLPPYTGNVAVGVFIVNNKFNHGDIDNICKCILDGLNGIAWSDDKQVKTLHAEMVVDKTRPEGVGVRIIPIDGTIADIREIISQEVATTVE